MNNNKFDNLTLLQTIFEEDNDGNIQIFAKKGKLILKEENSNEFNVFEIKVSLIANFTFSFQLNIKDYFELFFDVQNKTPENTEYTRPLESSLKYADLEIIVNNNLIILKDIIINSTSFKIFNNKIDIPASGTFNKMVINIESEKIGENEKIRVLKFIENINFKQNSSLKFKNKYLNGFYLNSCKIESSAKIFKNINGFFENKNDLRYSEDITVPEFENLEKLLYFYTSNLIYFPITILQTEDYKKTKIIVESYENPKNSGNSIFDISSMNGLYNFIESCYSDYLETEHENINLLFYYYVWFKNEKFAEFKILSGSVFMEILKNFGINDKYGNNKKIMDCNGCFYEKLDYVVKNQLQIDTSLLLQKLHPEIYQIFKIYEKKFLNKYKDTQEQNLISKIFSKSINIFILNYLITFRNNIAHEGNIQINKSDYEKIFNQIREILFNDNKIKEYENSKKLINEIYSKEKIKIIIEKFIINPKINNIYILKDVMEHFLEIILICLLKPNSKLINNKLFRNINSIEYVNKFLIN